MAWDPFERFNTERRKLLASFEELLHEANQHVNLISRQDEEHLFEHHILHCLCLASREFPAGSTVVDWGTGGGLPAIPLAIAFPDVHVVAVDAVRKKVLAVRSMARRLDLENVDAWHGRAEEFTGRSDHSVSRATAPLAVLWSWHARAARGRGRERGQPAGEPISEQSTANSETEPASARWPAGLVCLKGGDLSDEIRGLKEVEPHVSVQLHRIADMLDASYYEDKLIVACAVAAEPREDENR